jgi:hypothetical protein
MIRPVCRYLHHVPGKPSSFFRAGSSGQEKRRGQEHKCRDVPHCWLSQLTDDAVAGRIEDAAPVSFDQLIDDGAASPEPGERFDLASRLFQRSAGRSTSRGISSPMRGHRSSEPRITAWT